MTETTDPRLVAVWDAMADHFLDTETRQDLPMTALRCVEAGLSLVQAREVWKCDVLPAVGFNAFSVAGEWTGWNRAWLVGRIERVRRAPRWVRRARLAFSLDLMRGERVAIERCIALLEGTPPAQREQLTDDLTFLSRHAFDFAPQPLGAVEPAAQERIRALYPDPFERLIGPALMRDEAPGVRARLSNAGLTTASPL
jgi:hypothetical protein